MTSLPRLALLTDRAQTNGPIADVVRAAVDAGCRMVILREKDLPRAERADLAEDLAVIVHTRGGLLISAGELLPGCDGVHLPRPAPGLAPPPRCARVIGQSCHDRAELLAVEPTSPGDPVVTRYVTVSPVFASESKPGYGPALDVTALADLASATPIPVFALGGIDTAERAAACRAAGAHGVAVMGAVMRAADPAAVIASLLAATEVVRP